MYVLSLRQILPYYLPSNLKTNNGDYQIFSNKDSPKFVYLISYFYTTFIFISQLACNKKDIPNKTISASGTAESS